MVKGSAQENGEATTLPFKYVGGDVSLDLVNTVDWTREGLVNERLTDYERLVEWAEGAELLQARTARELRRLAKSQPAKAAATFAEAHELREFFQRLFRSVAAGKRSEALWEEFNLRLRGALEHLRVAPRHSGKSENGVADWDWLEPGRHLDAMLWPVLRSAAELLTSEDASRIEVCDGVDCGWMYVDRSRNHLRRWCEMETCGTAAKTRRRRERNRRAASRASAARPD